MILLDVAAAVVAAFGSFDFHLEGKSPFSSEAWVGSSFFSFQGDRTYNGFFSFRQTGPLSLPLAFESIYNG